MPEFSAYERLAAVPAAVLVDHDVVLAGDQLVPVAVLAEPVDVRSDGVGRADKVQRAPLPRCNKTGQNGSTTSFVCLVLFIQSG